MLATASLISALLAAPAPAAFNCPEARARAAILADALAACSRDAQPACALPAPEPALLPLEELQQLTADLETTLRAHCPVSAPAAARPPRRLLRPGPAQAGLLALAGAAANASDDAMALNRAWGELAPAGRAPVSARLVLFPPQLPTLPAWNGPTLSPYPQLTMPTMPDLRPSLTPTPTPDLQPTTPATSSPREDFNAQPPAASPCADLRDKAGRLRGAADQCDSDVAAGAPRCHVDVTFRSPSIPKVLSSGSARSYADAFDRVADAGDESACAEYGEEGLIPSANSPTELQLPGSGVGPTYRRTWSTTISNGTGAYELMRAIKSDINRFSRGGGIADTPFAYDHGPNPHEITVGNVYRIDGPGRINPYVVVTESDSRSFELTTLAGHPEAGRVRFMAYDTGGSTVFTIRVFGHPATITDKALYGLAGYWVQTQIWDNFTENVREYSGGVSTPIERTSIKE